MGPAWGWIVALITADQAKVYLPGLTGTDTDTTLNTLIARAEEMLAEWLDYPAVLGVRSMASTVYTAMRLDGPGGTVLRLPAFPIVSIASIYDDPALAFGSSTLLASTDYEYDAGTGKVYLLPTGTHGAWSTGERVIKVTFTAGFASTPPSLAHALGLLCKHIYRGRREAGTTSTSSQGGSVSTEARIDIPKEVRLAASGFRRSPVSTGEA